MPLKHVGTRDHMQLCGEQCVMSEINGEACSYQSVANDGSWSVNDFFNDDVSIIFIESGDTVSVDKQAQSESVNCLWNLIPSSDASLLRELADLVAVIDSHYKVILSDDYKKAMSLLVNEGVL